MMNKENETYELYQLKDTPECRDLMFLSFDRYYVDSFGFRQVPEFFADNPLKKVEEMLEDDYGMIDGIINNGDRRKDDDEKKYSVMDKIQEKKKEAAVAENNVPKSKEAAKKQEAELS